MASASVANAVKTERQRIGEQKEFLFAAAQTAITSLRLTLEAIKKARLLLR